MLIGVLSAMPAGLIAGLLFNGTAIAVAYWVVWRLLRKRLAHRRIQRKRRVDTRQIRREIGNACRVLMVGSLFSGIVTYWGAKGYTMIYLDIDAYPLWVAVAGFPCLIVLNDTWFYWCHRLLHHPRIYRYVHLEHHRSVEVNPFTSMSFHFIEPTLLTAWTFIVALTVPIYAPVLLLLQVFGLFENIKSHLGYELYPKWFSRGASGWLSTSTYHSEHHSRFHGNYGLHFRFWDRMMGTEFADYEQTYRDIHDRKPARIAADRHDDAAA